MPHERMPVAFLPHGGGPWPFVDMGIADKKGVEAFRGSIHLLLSRAELPDLE